MTIFIICFLGAYLLGSVPSAVWIGKNFYGIDVRQHGSGNAGATNTLRVLGKKAGFVVLGIDALKGFAAASLAILILPDAGDENLLLIYKIVLGFIAVLGHVYPVFAGFKGGKGIATLLGVVIALNAWLALYCFLLFVLTVSITHYISVGSMLSAMMSPLIAFWLNHYNINPLFYFCCAVAVLVIYTHRANIKRLAAGSENRFSFNKKST
ncbi:MAG: glycerol-3-phosphate 1-O-acyltransferase PlsY [Bacteroidota bacterium]|jgi:glycerol-3-phosphate acyltransferase PlsY